MSRCSVPNWVGSGEGRSTLPGKPTASRSPRSRQTQGFACRMFAREGNRLRPWPAKWMLCVHERSQQEPMNDRVNMSGLLQIKSATDLSNGAIRKQALL